MREIKKVFIAGGTGFLGYPTAEIFIERKVRVDTIALEHELKDLDFMDKRIGLSFGNLFEMKDKELKELFAGKDYDAIIYALGPDDRVTPNAPAYDFFHEKLVQKCYHILEIAKKCGVKGAVILSSYFAYYDKILDGKLSKYHPYIRARIEQQEKCFELADENFFVNAVELPYIFGVGPNRKPIWKDSFLAHFDGFNSIYFPKGGGTAIIDRIGVAEAVVACTYVGESKKAYPIATDNITYKEMLKIMLDALGDTRKVVEIPGLLCALGTKSFLKKFKEQGKEPGLYYPKLMNGVLNKKFYIDPEKSMNDLHFSELGFSGGKNAREEIIISMQALK